MLEWGLLSEVVQDRLTAMTSLVVQQRLWGGRASPAWHVASVAVAPGSREQAQGLWGHRFNCTLAC